MPDVTTTMTTLLACVVAQLATDERPVCENGITVGPPVIGPANCCTCNEGTEDEANGQVSVFLEQLYPVNGDDFAAVTLPCRNPPTAADMTFVLARCYPAIDETGNMPDLDTTTDPSEALNADMKSVWAGIKCCTGVGKLVIRESAVDSDPEGGCSAFAVRISVLVNV